MGIREAFNSLWTTKAQDRTLMPQSEAELPGQPEQAIQSIQNRAILKSPSPTYLVQPPFGIPLNKNVPAIRALGMNGYVFSATQTISDEIAAAEWEIVQKDGVSVSDADLAAITTFFDNPNGNDESFAQILRKTVPDILEIDAGVWVKSFTFERYLPRTGARPARLQGGKLTQLFAKDGGSFLMNPDVYGYLGNRAEYVPPILAHPGVPAQLRPQLQQATRGKLPQEFQEQFVNLHRVYSSTFLGEAAYFQYPTRSAQLPVPFGRREVVYMMRNPRTDNHYGRGALEMLADVVYTLVYGSKYNLDFYLNNNMPEGVVAMLGANTTDIKRFKEHLMKEYRGQDNFGNIRKFFYRLNIVSQDTKWIPFQLPPQQMQVLEQQSWFVKLLWACFGVNADEMGFTEDSNRAVSHVQSAVVKRKVINPLLKLFEYYVNRSVISEFGVPGVEFKFIDYDLDEEHKKVDLYQKEYTMGLRSRRDIAEEIGIDFDKQLAEREKDGDKLESQSSLFEEGMVPRGGGSASSAGSSHLGQEEGSAAEGQQDMSELDRQVMAKAAAAEVQQADDIKVFSRLFRAWETELLKVLDDEGAESDEQPRL